MQTLQFLGQSQHQSFLYHSKHFVERHEDLFGFLRYVNKDKSESLSLLNPCFAEATVKH